MFSTPTDFLAFLQRMQEHNNENIPEYWREEHELMHRDKDFKKHLPDGYLKKAIENLGGNNNFSEEEAFEFLSVSLFEMATKSFYKNLPSKLKGELENDLAIGKAMNYSFKSSIYKSVDDKYAIVISIELIRILTIHTCFMEAIAKPENVIFQSITADNRKLSPDEYQLQLNDLMQIASEGRPTPIVNILFNEEGLKVVTCNFIFILHFIIAHEIAHYLYNDFKNDTFFSLTPNLGETKKFTDTTSHEIEYRADDLAVYMLLKFIIPYHEYFLEESYCIFMVARFLELLHDIGIKETETHPHPLKRIIDICEKYVPKTEENEMFWQRIIPSIRLKLQKE